jgi:hypothetical protein
MMNHHVLSATLLDLIICIFNTCVYTNEFCNTIREVNTVSLVIMAGVILGQGVVMDGAVCEI